LYEILFMAFTVRPNYVEKNGIPLISAREISKR
jgi:uncharacterized DUF497 family protein